jgi:DNA-binding NarL/FixJ family response regulator
MSVQEISEEMCLSKNTVSTYKQRMFEKMGFENNADLFRYTAKMEFNDTPKKNP